MSRRIYSRRHIEVSWVGAGEPKKVKPVEPLRYRIAPWEKKLDVLDTQERELVSKWDAKQIEWDEYEELLAVITTARASLDVRRRKATGEDVKPVKAPRERVERVPVVKVKATYHEPQHKLTPLQIKLWLLVAIFLTIVIHNA